MVLLAAGLSVLLAGTAGAEGPDSRLERQIGVMERILDEVMVESPNFLVHSSEPTHGLYLDEFGVLFVITASFTSNYEDWKDLSFPNFSIEQDDDGNVIILKRKSSKDTGDEDEDVSWREIQEKRQAEQYAAGKQELVDAVLDYGETLSALQGSQSVAVALFLEDYEYMDKDGMSRLVIKARMEDLRSFSAERLSRDAMAKKLSIEEY
jgi:hypothetical protein